MWRGGANGHLGVTFLSGFPSPDAYYLLAQRTDAGTVRLSAQGAGPFSGDTDSGVSLLSAAWYRFTIAVLPEGSGVRVRARIWRDGQAEPAGWSIDALDPSDATAPRTRLLGCGRGEGHRTGTTSRSPAAPATHAAGVPLDHASDFTLNGAASFTLQWQAPERVLHRRRRPRRPLRRGVHRRPLALLKGAHLLAHRGLRRRHTRGRHRIARDATPPTGDTSPGRGRWWGEPADGHRHGWRRPLARCGGRARRPCRLVVHRPRRASEGSITIPSSCRRRGQPYPAGPLGSTASPACASRVGRALADTLFNRAVTPVVEATDATRCASSAPRTARRSPPAAM